MQKWGKLSNIDQIKGSRALKWCDYHKVNFVSKDCPLCRGGEVKKIENEIEIKSKICSVCKIEKPVKEYYKNTSNKNGYCYMCIECDKKYQKQRKKLKN